MQLIYNCFAGISGDMNLAAMLDLGMDKTLLLKELSKLNLDREFNIEVYGAERSGINGTQVKVNLTQECAEHGDDHGHSHSHKSADVAEHSHSHRGEGEHNHDHSHEQKHEHSHSHEQKHEHGHSHEQKHSHSHDHSHAHRNFTDIAHIIDSSTLAAPIKELSKEIFMEVAIAEAKVHNKPIDKVHFHEVGAIDSIVDIVGAAICYHHLGVTNVVSTPPELGGGFVKCQHGLMPVPAPATAEILRDIPSTTGAVQKEMTTPTGAAILKVITDKFIESPKLNIDSVAYGIGHRVTDIPNVLRIYRVSEISDTDKIETLQVESERVIECTIDDMTPEAISFLTDSLMSKGAKDVTVTSIVMKKGRPAHLISILTSTEQFNNIAEQLFIDSSTIGFRSYSVDKYELPREIVTHNTPWGDVRVKVVTLPNGAVKSKLEFDDISSIAKRLNSSLSEIRERVELHISKES